MQMRSILAATFVVGALACATLIAIAAVQPRWAATDHAANENSINRLPVPPDLPLVEVDEAW